MQDLTPAPGGYPVSARSGGREPHVWTAVADVTEQLGEPGAVFPVVGGWCCPRSP